MSSARDATDGSQGNHRRRFRGPALLIIAAVMAWGVYLAIGAATNESQDVRKAAIIVICTIGFLLFWTAFLFRAVKSRGSDALSSDSTVAQNDQNQWNVASVYSFAAALGVNGLLAPILFAQHQLSDLSQGRLLVAAFLLASSASLAAVIGLSRTNKPKGHRLAFVAVGLLLLGLILGVTVLRKSARQPIQTTRAPSLARLVPNAL